MPERLSTFYQIRGSLDSRIELSTGLPGLDNLRENIFSKPTRITTDLLIPSACNQNCPHCFYIEEEGIKDKDTPQLHREVSLLIKYLGLSDTDNPFSIIYPREISSALDLLPFYQAAKQNKILTNASALDERTVSLFKKFGIKQAITSLHGTEESHIGLTGTDERTYQNTLRGIQLMQDAGIKVDLYSVIYKENYDKLPEFVDLLKSRRLRSVQFISYSLEGRARADTDDHTLTQDDLIDFLSLIDRQRILNPDLKLTLRSMTYGPNFYSKNTFRALAGEGSWNAKYLCWWTSNQYLGISLGSNKIYPCFRLTSFPGQSIGEVKFNEEDKVELEKTNPGFDENELSQKLTGQCSTTNCEYQKLCLGGCRVRAFSAALKKGFSEAEALFAGQDICLTRILDNNN